MSRQQHTLIPMPTRPEQGRLELVVPDTPAASAPKEAASAPRPRKMPWPKGIVEQCQVLEKLLRSPDIINLPVNKALVDVVLTHFTKADWMEVARVMEYLMDAGRVPVLECSDGVWRQFTWPHKLPPHQRKEFGLD